MRPSNNKSVMLLGLMLLPLLGGCQGTSGNVGVGWGDPEPPPREADRRPMPPAHAPAHGRRAQERHRQYRYYPGVGVYFDSERGIYFYYSDGRWRVSAELPYRFRMRLGESVTITAHAGEPYRDYRRHRAKYPPGRGKGRGNGPPPGKGPFNGEDDEE